MSSAGIVVLGALLCVVAAVIMAASMTVQRYALAYPQLRVLFPGGISLTRGQFWTVGLIIYGIANGFYTFGLNFAPLSLCGAIFATVLVFNLAASHFVLGEALTKRKCIGCLLVLGGVLLCTVGAPVDSTQYSASDVAGFGLAASGLLYFFTVFLILAFMMVQVVFFERRYPFKTQDPDNSQLMSMPGLPVAQRVLMGIVYPASLGIQEGLCQLGLKGFVNMSAAITSGDTKDLRHPMFWINLTVTGFFCFLALGWLGYVYRRCETSKALPIEYGTVSAVAVLSGLIFFQEHEKVAAAGMAMMLCGILIIGLGIALGVSGGGPSEDQALKARLSHRLSQASSSSRTTVPIHVGRSTAMDRE